MEEYFIFAPFALGVFVCWLVMRGRAAAEAEQAAAGGSRRIYWPAWFAVVDVETTALAKDAHRGSLVSIGAVHPLTGETFYCQCWVREGAYIDPESMAVHMADWTDDRTQPSEAEAITRLVHWAKKRGIKLIGGKNPMFDLRWLEAAWMRAQEGRQEPGKFPLTHRTLDLHSLALAWALINRPVVVTSEGFKTDDVYRLLGMPDEPKPHHALTGARMEAKAFRVILEQGGVL
jgi:hypothetical protein